MSDWPPECKAAALNWMKEERSIDLAMSRIANDLLAGFQAGWEASILDLFKAIQKETGHLTLASLISEWKGLKDE